MNRRLFLPTVFFMIVVAFIFSACVATQPAAAPAEPAEPAEPAPVKAAVLLEGPLADTGWNTSSWEALQGLSEKYDWEVTYTDNVKTEDMEDLLRGYGQQEYDLIFGPGWLFGDPMVEISSEFPDTHWVNVNLNTTAGDNFSSNGWVTGELAYFLGRVAAEASKSGKLGWIGGTESPLIAYDFETYTQGATEINPDSELTISYVGSWQDPAKAKELAQAQIEAGVDVILTVAGSGDLGVFEAITEAQENGTEVWLMGWTGDQCEFLPDYTLASVVQLPGFLLEIAGEEYQASQLQPGHSIYGVKDNAQYIAWCGENVPKETQEEVNQMIQEYINGELDVPHRTDL